MSSPLCICGCRSLPSQVELTTEFSFYMWKLPIRQVLVMYSPHTNLPFVGLLSLWCLFAYIGKGHIPHCEQWVCNAVSLFFIKKVKERKKELHQQLKRSSNEDQSTYSHCEYRPPVIKGLWIFTLDIGRITTVTKMLTFQELYPPAEWCNFMNLLQ